MRSAVARLARETKIIEPLVPVDLVIDHSVQVDFASTSDAFMRNMVRILVGTMLEASGGRRTPKSFHELLEGAPRSAAGDTAPSHGLYLESVGY